LVAAGGIYTRIPWARSRAPMMATLCSGLAYTSRSTLQLAHSGWPRCATTTAMESGSASNELQYTKFETALMTLINDRHALALKRPRTCSRGRTPWPGSRRTIHRGATHVAPPRHKHASRVERLQGSDNPGGVGDKCSQHGADRKG